MSSIHRGKVKSMAKLSIRTTWCSGEEEETHKCEECRSTQSHCLEWVKEGEVEEAAPSPPVQEVSSRTCVYVPLSLQCGLIFRGGLRAAVNSHIKLCDAEKTNFDLVRE